MIVLGASLLTQKLFYVLHTTISAHSEVKVGEMFGWISLSDHN